MECHVIIADDLTGALDTGVQFASIGVPIDVTVYASPNSASACRSDFSDLADRVGLTAPPGEKSPGVTAVDLESRHLSPSLAAKQVTHLVSSVQQLVGEEHSRGLKFYKKTDSTLRGNIGSELEALLTATSSDLICFVPAYPTLGRTTVNGTHFVRGKPLHRTEFAEDRRAAVHSGTVAEIIEEQTSIPTEHVTMSKIRGGFRLSRRPPRIVICDAVTDEDMRLIGRWLTRQDVHYQTAGCGGFASILPDVWNLAPRTRAAAGTDHVLRTHTRRICVVSGSVHPKARRQIRTAQEDSRFRSCTDGGADIIQPSEQDDSRHPDAVVSELAREAYQSIRKDPPGVLVVFGGDTLAAVLDALNVATVRPLFEFEPGVVVSAIDSPVLPRTPTLVTKAGGFGSDELLLRICDDVTRVTEREAL